MGAGVSAQEPGHLRPAESPNEEVSEQERQRTDGPDGRTVQKNGQISGIHGNSEDQDVINGKLEQLNGLQEEVIPGKVEPTSLFRDEELEEMELEQKETPPEVKDEQKDSQEATDPSAEIGEEAQAGEIGFKKVFKFVGCKFTVKKEKPVKLEPVQLLTVKKDEDGEVGSESKQEKEGSTNGEVSPVAEEAEGSPPEVLSPGKMEESTGQAEPKPAAAEEISVTVESAASPAESPAVDSPLKRFFRQGFFSVLRRKPSFKKAKDEPLVIGEKTEVIGEKTEESIATEEVNGDHGTKTQKETSASQEAAEILDVQTVEEKSERDDGFEDLTAELASVKEAKEALGMDDGKDGICTEQNKLQGPELVAAAAALEKDRMIMRNEPSASAGGEVKTEFASIGAPEGPCAEQTDIVKEQSLVKVPEPIMGEAELLSSQEKVKLQGSPLKKLFTSSSIKKLSGKKTKAKKGDAKLGDAGDDVRLQSSTESEGSPEGQKSESPLTPPEEMGEMTPAETVEAPEPMNPEAEGVNCATNGEAKKESITAWASFKKLVTSKKRPKIPSDSDKEDEQIDKVKSATLSSNESAASVEREEAKSIDEEQSLEQSIDDPKKKADAPVSWEALICVGSSKKRARKLSDSDAPNEEAQKLTEERGQAQDGAEELQASSLQDTDQEPGGTPPEGVASPVEDEVSGAVSTWESFKRLVTSRRKSKSKLEERADESVTSTEAVLPETESAKEESWASFKKLIPGRRKKRSDAKPEQPLAEGWAEFGVSKSDEESDTPAVVPLSEYDAVEEERMTKEQQITITTDSVHTDEVLTLHEAPAETGETHAEKTVTMEREQLDVIKSSIDERSPSWISAAVSDAIEQRVEETVVMNELVKEEVALGDAIPLAEATSETYTVEIAEEAQEMISEVVTAPEYPAEESLTEETTEMVSAVSQLTETPVTTAEGTPIREDEALVTRQTQEVLQEAAEKVKLSAGPVVSFCEMMVASEMQGSQREPEISVGKIQDKVVEPSCEMELPESARKGESEKSDAASKVSNGIIQVATVNVQQECGKMVEQTMIKMQEASGAQSLEPKTIPPIESTSSARLEPTVEVVQEVEVEVQHMGECSVSREEQIDGPVGLKPKFDEEIAVNKIVAAEVETGMSEAVGEKVGTENVQCVLEETSGVSRAEDVVKPEVTCEESIKAFKTSCMEKVLPECEETFVAAPAEIAEKMGREVIEAIPAEISEKMGREATEAISATSAGKVEAMLEQTSGAIPEVAHQIRVEKVEAVLEETVGKAQEIGGEVAVEICREILVSGKNIEMVCERSTEIISVDVTEAVCNEETIEITPVVTVSEVCGEETVNIIPAVEVTEAVLGEENVQITPVVGVTEVLHSEETIKSTPVVEVEVACREKAIKISPVVVTEIVCSEDTTKITPVVGVMEATESEETVKINPVVEVMEVVCTEDTHAMLEAKFNWETTEISPVVNVIDTSPVVAGTEAVCGQEAMDASPVVVETEAAHGQEGTNIGPVLGETEALRCRDAIDASPVKEVEVAHSQGGTDVGPVVVEMEAVREEAIDASPVVVETEAVRGEEAIDASPVVVETETVCSEGTIAVGLVEVGVEEGKAVYEEKGDLAITKLEEIEKNVQIMATGDKIAHEQFSAVTIMQEMVETKACEETVGANMETEMNKAACGETTKTLEGMDEEQRPKEQVVEMLIPATEIIHPEPSIVELSKETIQTLVTESTIIEVVKRVETEVVDTICNVKLVEVPETVVVESVTKEFEMNISCVPSKPQSTATEEVKATHEGESLEQVIELVEEVGCELSTVEKGKPGPREAAFFETPHTDGQLDGANKDGQADVTIPKLCEATERAAELQKGDADGATDDHLIKLESPGELASTETSTEGGKEGSKLDEGLTLGSDHEVKLHSGSIDEFHAVRSETVTLIVDPSGTENSEPLKVLFPVTAATVEEQVLAETVVPVVTELSELGATDQVLQLSQPDVVQGLVVETAAAIVEVAIEAAAGSMVDTPGVSHKIGSTSDGQRQQSSSTDRLEGGLVEHTIGVEQRLQSLESETKLEVGQTKTFEQQSTMLAQGLMQDVVMSTVGIEAQVSAEHEHGQDDEQMHKEDEEKIPGLQLVTTTEGKCNEVVCQRVQTQESKETGALEKEVAVTQSIELVSEAAVEGDQKAGASVETEWEKKSLSDHVSEGSASLPDVSKMTEVECCQSFEKPEGTHPSLKLARKDQPVNAQPQAEEQTSQDVPAKMISPIEDRTPEAANEKLEGDAMESTGNNDEETDQNQAFKAVEKPGNEEMQIGHQMDQSSTVECAKGAAEKTPS
ncbi:A-kinase anchor protein 12b isoform X2 [Scyliorhinus torazame]|uniref:A-kinase anchor protein 12b isoform X2 n=1 Tax=Scyliorhinus torazame TaxID=75743 RepID=UPI003B5CF7D6